MHVYVLKELRCDTSMENMIYFKLNINIVENEMKLCI